MTSSNTHHKKRNKKRKKKTVAKRQLHNIIQTATGIMQLIHYSIKIIMLFYNFYL